MTLPEKLDILIRRKGVSKTDLAEEVGITYRALANYISGDRRPRKAILGQIADKLGVSAEFLLNDRQGLILDSKERFIFNATSGEKGINAALSLLSDAEKTFSGGELTDDDKRALYSCIADVYFGAKAES